MIILLSWIVFLSLASPIVLTPHRVTLSSKDLLTSVNSLLNSLSLPIVDLSKQQKKTGQHGIQFKIIEIERFYDFTKIPKISIEYEIFVLKVSFFCKLFFFCRTWLTSNVDAARVIAKKHQDLLQEINDKVNGIKDRFKLKSIEYSDEWSVPQFYSCLRTLLMYADKWHERLLALKGITLLKNTFFIQKEKFEIHKNSN